MRSPVIVNNVLYGCDRDVAEMVRQLMPYPGAGFSDGCVALGVVRRNKLLGGVVFDQYDERNILMSGGFTSPAWASPKTLRQLFAYPFVQLGLRRMTTITAANNASARALDERLGFKQEGILRAHYPGDVDAILYGMLREECRWLD